MPSLEPEPKAHRLPAVCEDRVDKLDAGYQ